MKLVIGIVALALRKLDLERFFYFVWRVIGFVWRYVLFYPVGFFFCGMTHVVTSRDEILSCDRIINMVKMFFHFGCVRRLIHLRVFPPP